MKLILTFLVLQLGDVATTAIAGHRGGFEANPVVAAALAAGWTGWALWVLVKLVMAGLLALWWAVAAAGASWDDAWGYGGSAFAGLPRDVTLVAIGASVVVCALNLWVALA